MTNNEVQNIIEINDMCKLRYNKPDDLFRFLGYESCEWQLWSGNTKCQACKGRMIFIEDSIDRLSIKCHSMMGDDGCNHSDVEIIQKYILPEELFEL